MDERHPRAFGRAFRCEDYLEQTQAAGVAGTIFMETTPDEPHWRDEASFVDELASRPGSIIKGIIANGRPEEEGFERYVDSLPRERLVGLRRILHVVPDDVSREPRFAANVRWLGKQRLTFDMCFLARQLPIAIELARKCDQTQLILDHCGVPDIAAGALDPSRANIRQLAALPNVACKISGVLAYCKPDNATLDAVKPYVDHCIECFGPDRLVWGSDWPVVTINSTLAKWIEISRELVGPLSEIERRQILSGNVRHIYQAKI